MSYKDSLSENLSQDYSKLKQEFEKEPKKFENRLENILEENIINGRKLTQEERKKIIKFLSVFTLDEINKIKQMIIDLKNQKLRDIETKKNLTEHLYKENYNRIVENLNHKIKNELIKLTLMPEFNEKFSNYNKNLDRSI